MNALATRREARRAAQAAKERAAEAWWANPLNLAIHEAMEKAEARYWDALEAAWSDPSDHFTFEAPVGCPPGGGDYDIAN